MTDETDRLAATLPHLRRASLKKGDAVALPIVAASMFHLPGEPSGFRQYGRFDNDTWAGVEKALGHLEGAPALAFPSGMAAIAAALFANAEAGQRILLPSDGYYTTRVLAERFLKPLGVAIDTRPTAGFCEGGFDGYSIVFAETPSNPGLDLCDLSEVARLARQAGALTIADNTTMTPFGQRPLDLGIDILVASDTKAPGGHSDVLFGHVATRDAARFAAMSDWRKLSGSIPGPFEAWQVHRGLETLELRFDRMCSSASLLASRLAEHRAVGGVSFPGLPTHPQHALAERQMLRHGFLIGITLAGSEAAEAFIDGCALIQPATSFGGVHTSAERRARWGDSVPGGFVRLSVGCEPVEDLWSALEGALEAAAA